MFVIYFLQLINSQLSCTLYAFKATNCSANYYQLWITNIVSVLLRCWLIMKNMDSSGCVKWTARGMFIYYVRKQLYFKESFSSTILKYFLVLQHFAVYDGRFVIICSISWRLIELLKLLKDFECTDLHLMDFRHFP